MTMKRIATNGDETDVHGKWRHVVRWRRGEVAKIKNRTNRRERRQGQDEINEALFEGIHRTAEQIRHVDGRIQDLDMKIADARDRGLLA